MLILAFIPKSLVEFFFSPSVSYIDSGVRLQSFGFLFFALDKWFFSPQNPSEDQTTTVLAWIKFIMFTLG